MTVMSFSWTLHLLPLFLLLSVATVGATTISITNRCSYTVWPAAVPVGGLQLDPGESWTVNMPSATAGRVWPRTGCSFNDTGNGSCQTGDCGGVLACAGKGQAPQTVAEFTLGRGTDFFDISLINGFNVPMDFLPVPANGQGGQGCSKGPRCAADITSQCPSDLKAPGGCNNACTVFKQDKYCCTGNGSCGPTNYTEFFKRMCPDAYSYPFDTSNTTWTCPSGTNYQVIFCPPSNISALASPPTANPPSPIVTEPTHMNSSSSSRSRVFDVILGSVSSSIVLVIFITFFAYKRRKWRQREVQEGDEEFGELPGLPTRFTFQQLQEATGQFRAKLGEGGFGSVFQGQYGEERIAVKRLDRAGQGKREFLAEVQTIGNIHHINLVRLIGFCAEKSHRLLVYEYMPNCSLDRWIYCRHDSNNPPLDWQTRHKIITHIAKGLSYLHEECMKRIAHLDVKPQNILLDENFNAKLSDFGLCKLIDRDKSQVITRMRGTPGYLAPEWLTSQITEKVDVYSFGVVVMEIISGRRNLDTSRSEESIHLITLLEEKVKSDELAYLIDKHSSDMQVHKQEVIQMMKLAMWCLQVDCKRRPQMSEVVRVLEGNMDAESNIDHNFVANSPAMLWVAENIGLSDPPVATDLSGPR
ncbi:PR5-like receptor kinase [Phragmites australis]|uniref:PR5-like receptor kinase n=1 Tax=Phragmites australis TaxID=29695 RepID=UPI002D775A6D|nr:PR5-like receptor kinase [Phragmites australis]